MGKSTDKRWKGHVINWLEIADMDDVTYDYKLLNQQQVAILLALLEYQKWATRWTNLELDNSELLAFVGDIEDRLMRSELSMSIDYDAWYDANKRAMYDAINDVAKQIVSGRTFDISIASDGTVSNPADDVNELPESPADNPLTPLIREDWAAQMGGAIAVSVAVALFIAKIDTAYGVVNGTPVMSLSDCQFLIKTYFECDAAAMDAAIAGYYTYRNTNGRIVFTTSDSTESYLFCNGANELGLKKWTIDQSAYPAVKQAMFLTLVAALADAFWTGYYSSGLLIPSTEYRAAACTPFDTEIITFTGADFTGSAYKSGGVVNKNSHRVLLDVTGKVNDTLGGVQDFFWRKDNLGALTFVGNATANGTWQVNSNWSAPSASEVPYRADGHYQVTRDIVNTGAGFLTIRRKLTELGAGGSFVMTITDLGQMP